MLGYWPQQVVCQIGQREQTDQIRRSDIPIYDVVVLVRTLAAYGRKLPERIGGECTIVLRPAMSYYRA
eukprot:10564163-Alexandrium_andersonii.AAC.1